MHIRNWIYDRGDTWLQDLVDHYKVDIAKAEERQLVSLRYNPIESPMGEAIVQECRGMIVHGYGRDAKIVAHPYNKFWNHGEKLAAPIDWASARVFEKLDGSLCIMYFFDGVWQFGSAGTPLGGGSYNKRENLTFGEMFRRTFEENHMQYPNPGYWNSTTFCFEFVSPDNRIVVPYKERKLILHGARDIARGEFSIETLEPLAKQWRWPVVRHFPITSVAEALAAAAELSPTDPTQGEGFIVVDGEFNRIKIKSPRYVALHYLRDRTTPRAVINAWKMGEESELLAYYPDESTEIIRRIEAACTEAFNAYSAAKHAKDRKEFALMVKDHPWSSLCFKLLNERDPSLEVTRKLMRGTSESLTDRLIADLM